MIVVKVELWSAITGQKTEIARMNICNIGGSETLGDYQAETLRGRCPDQFARRTIQRAAKVLRHQRKQLHVWNLVAKALNAMEYGR